MKKIIIALLALSMPILVNAQSSGLFSKKKINMQQEYSYYLQPDAVPVVDGKVTYSVTIAAPGKSKAELYAAVSTWADLRYEPNQSRGEWRDANFFCNTENATITVADKAEGTLTTRGAEEMIFSNKALAKDYTLVYYVINLKVTDGAINFTMTNISYVYTGGSENPERVTAEDWITDKESINKKGELRRISGKFRVKTIDLKDELVKEITDAVK